ncbi:MAG: MmcQ/YjbR family DNA-binding protein [Bacteroidota bacterium]
MDIEKIRNYCLKKPHVTEGFPFNEDMLVFKVMNKMFCLLNLTPPHTINLKCDPEFAIELREQYEAVKPGYHMNKKHWNTIELDGNIPDKEITAWINHSYELVVSSLPKKLKA